MTPSLLHWYRRFSLALLTVLLLMAGGRPAPVLSQGTPISVEVNHVATEEQGDGLNLRVFFVVRDSSGRPIPRPNIERTTLQVLSDSGTIDPPTPADFFDPQTPLYLALMIATGGSAPDTMPFLKQVAKAVVDLAPPNAAIGVIPFANVSLNQSLAPLSNFTMAHDLVKRDIDLVQDQPGGPNCIYNALYNAIELLDRQVQNPQDRRAIILITDGRDATQSGEPCSERSYENVSARAVHDADQTTPIFTIGLQEGGAQVDSAELIAIAEATRAYYYIGGRNDIGQRYQTIVESLYGQVVAQATVFAPQGQNNGVLRVKLRESPNPLSAAFSFNVARDVVRTAASGPVEVRIAEVFPNSTDNSYTVQIIISNAEEVGELFLRVDSKDTGTRAIQPQSYRSPVPAILNAKLEGSLNEGQEYVITILANDRQGNLITKPSDGFSSDNNEVLDQYTFKTEVRPTPAPPQVTIESVQQDWTNNQLLISLIYPPDAGLDRYRVAIIDVDTNAPAYASEVRLLNDQSVIEVPIPESMRTSPTVDYRIDLYFELDDGTTLVEPASIPITLRQPPPPPLWSRIWTVVRDEQWVQATIGVIVLSTLGLLLITRRKPKKKDPLPPPPIEYTGVHVVEEIPRSAAPSPTPVPPRRSLRLRVKLVQGQKQARGLDTTVTNFPCEIGRHRSCDISLGDVTADNRISRRHIRISADHMGLVLTDLGSDNGTFIDDQRVPPNTSVRLDRTTLVRLGPATVLELHPEG